MKRMLFIATLSILFFALTGCAVSRQPLNQEPPYLLFLPGLSGDSIFSRQSVRSLKIGGLNAEYQIFDWCTGRNQLQALQNDEANRVAARALADYIVQRRAEYPYQQIAIVGYSGGAGIGVWALEQLPNDVQVDTITLLAPALSPTYDLSGALRHVRGKMYTFTSPCDWAVLGVLTHVFGTFDRRHTIAAGWFGFSTPSNADREQYSKLEQRHYNPLWLRFAYLGDHMTMSSTWFASGVLAPLLARDTTAQYELDRESRQDLAAAPPHGAE